MKPAPKGWAVRSIGELADVARGSSPRPIADERYFVGGNIPWIKIADATKSGKYLYETNEKVNQFGASFSRLLPAGSLIIAASGTLGYTQFLGVPGCVHDGWLYVTNLRGVDKDFLYYFFQWKKQHFYNSAYGAAIQNINTEILRKTEIILPPLPVQKRIGKTLSAYDDLIENNTRRIQILERMAQMLYREWFINFRFPGHEKTEMVDSGMGPIPRGLTASSVGKLCEEVRRGVDPTEIAAGTPYIGLEHMPRRSIALAKWGEAGQVQSTKLWFHRGEILFAKIRPYFHKVGVAPIDGVCSSDAIVIVPKALEYSSVVLMCVSSDDFIRQATQTSQGTKMPRANWAFFAVTPLPFRTSHCSTASTHSSPQCSNSSIILYSGTAVSVRPATYSSPSSFPAK